MWEEQIWEGPIEAAWEKFVLSLSFFVRDVTLYICVVTLFFIFLRLSMIKKN